MAVIPIKVLLTLALGLLLVYDMVQRVAPRSVRLGIASVVVAGLYFVWFPDHATVIANWLGVGRGTDLLIYVWILLSFGVALNLNFKLRAARREITELTRAIALSDAMEPTADELGSAVQEPRARGAERDVP